MTNRNIKIIAIYSCALETIESDSFDVLALDRITISYSELKSLPTNIFKFQFNLQELYLDHNKLEKVNHNVFRNLKNLRKLTLAGNIGQVSAKMMDERTAKACDCEYVYDDFMDVTCDLPKFITNDHMRAPTCFLELKKITENSKFVV